MYLKMVQFMRVRLVKGKPNGFGTHESGINGDIFEGSTSQMGLHMDMVQ